MIVEDSNSEHAMQDYEFCCNSVIIIIVMVVASGM